MRWTDKLVPGPGDLARCRKKTRMLIFFADDPIQKWADARLAEIDRKYSWIERIGMA